MQEAWIGDILVIASVGITIVVAVALLWGFFDLRTHLKRRSAKQNRLVRLLPGLEGDRPLRVRLKDGQTYSGLRLAGVMDADAARAAGLPHPLGQMVCFEGEGGARTWIDAAAIRVLESAGEDKTAG